MKLLNYVAGLAMVVVLAACGGGGGNPGTSGGVSPSPAPGSTAPTVSLELRDSTNATATTVTASQIFTLQATVRGASGALLEGQVVTFGGDSTLVKFSPVTGTARTGTDGVASIQVSPALSSLGGALNVTADVDVAGTAATQGSLGIAVVAMATSGVPSITMEMRNPAGTATTTLAVLDINTLRVTVRDALGNVAAGKSVAFSSSAGKVQFLPSASALTDANGFASIQVLRNTTTDVGTDTISAAVTVADIAAKPAALDIYVSPLANAGLATMTLGFKDLFNAGTTNVPRGVTTYAQIQLLGASGFPPPPTLVTFAGDSTLINFAATGLTNSAGFLSIPITAVSTSDPRAGTLRTTATVSGSALSASFDFQVTGGATVATGQAPVISSLELWNSASAPTPFVTSTDLFTMRATVKDSAGNPLAGEVVKFVGDAALVKFSPASGSALTNSAGVATIQISPALVTSSGASYIGADVTVGGIAAKQATLGVQVVPLPNGGQASISLVDPANATSTTISALASTTLRARVSDARGNALPGQSITFSSSSGKVKFSATGNAGSQTDSAMTDLTGVATIDISRSVATAVGTDVISAAVSVGGVPVTPATLTAYVSPLVNGGLPTATLGVRDASMTSSISTIPRLGTSYARVQLLDATGFAPVPTLVTLSGDATLINFTATGLTDITGVALLPITVVPTTSGGASTLRATANVPSTPGSSTLVPVAAAFDYIVPTGSTAGIPTLSVGLSSGGSTVAATGSTNAIAAVKDAAGAAVAGKMVTFTGNAALIKFSPSSGQVLSDSSGIASIVVSPVSILSSGASTLTASTSVGNTALTTSFDFQLADSNITLGALNLGANLAAYGTRSVSVPVTNVGGGIPASPVQVTFTTSCGTITPAIVTTDSTGTASTTYSANGPTGCAGTSVAISASAVGASTQTGTISVSSANATNIQFVSATPQMIYLKDSVGPTQSQLAFKVVDALNNGLSNRSLSLSLSNNATGVSINVLNNTTAVPLTSDSSGNVSMTVFSGTVPTSFTVKATLLDSIGNPTSVTASSNILTVAVGRPTQRSLSLALEHLSIEGFNNDNEKIGVTLYMADRQGNPVPPGTQVNFVTEAGVMLPPVCFVDANSSCGVSYRSQGSRPASGRTSIMAYVVGEEEFVDANGNNIYDCRESWTDLGLAYRDDNGAAGRNFIYDLGEFQLPRGPAINVCTNVLSAVTPTATAGDGVWGAADVRAQATLVLATGQAVFSNVSSLVANTAIDLSATKALPTITFNITDLNGNSLPFNTGINAVAIDNTQYTPAIASPVDPSAFTYPTCTLDAVTPTSVPELLGPLPVSVSLKSCVPGDQIRVTVTSPKGVATTRVFTIQ